MKIVWLILDVMRMHADISLHVIVNIIKFKRMQGSNYLSFGEQTIVFVIKKYTDDIAYHAHAQL